MENADPLEILRAKDPDLLRELRAANRLESYLDEQVERARAAYESLVKRVSKGNPDLESWAIQAAEELIIRDLLDPTT